MSHKYFNYKEKLNSKPRLVLGSEIPDNEEGYASIFKYNEAHKKRLEQTGTIAGITDVVTNTLVWDFDSKNDLEKVRADVLELGNRLVSQYSVDPDSIQCYFSGNKGAHVVLNIDSEITPDQFKKATGEIAKGLETFDSVVSDPQRVLRLEYTKHPKSGLYKIPLHIAEVEEMTMEEIKVMAKSNRDHAPSFDYNPSVLPKSLFTLPVKKVTAPSEDFDYDYSTPPRGWKKYKWALAQGWFDSGERHNALMVIAATARGLGFSKEHTYYLCKAALKKQSARTGDEEFDKQELFENIIENSVFSGTWDGGQYSPDNNPWLKRYCERMQIDVKKDVDNIVQLYHIEEEFVDYVKNIDKNTILTGIPELDAALPLTIGMNLGVIGAASSGKTALCLKILENTSEAGVISVFASLDMRRNRLYEKLLYRLSGLSRTELYSKIQNGEAGPIFELVRQKYKNVYFYDRSCPSVDDIRNYTLAIEEQTGQKVKLVMVDYFERVNAERSDDTAASKEVAGKLQDLVNDLNVCLITLVQPNKFAISGGPDTPILNYSSIKGSSFLYQAFRSIISIWRPFFTPELKDNDKYLQMAILKNDLGELNMFNFGWDGKRGEIWGLTEEGEEDLERLMTIKAQDRANANGNGDDWQ